MVKKIRTFLLFVYFAIIQSKFRLIKRQQYLNNMYKINFDDYYEGMFSHIQSFVKVLKVFGFLYALYSI